MLTVKPIKAYQDNYIWLLVNGNNAVAIDPGDAFPVLSYLEKNQLNLTAILITHHHLDHVAGINSLLISSQHAIPVYGPASEAILEVTHKLNEGDILVPEGLSNEFQIIDIPGHTSGHIAYYSAPLLFCGDTLFSGGCGRLFEGTPAQMLTSLDKLSALPSETQVYCAHEYTETNLKFATAVEPKNGALKKYQTEVRRKRQQDQITLPSTIGLEQQINPFLRSDKADVRSAAERFSDRALNTRTEVFTAVRAWKDNF